MKTNVKATGIKLTPAISSYVNEKVSSLRKYLDQSQTDLVAQVEVGKTTQHHKKGDVFKAEVHITGVGLDLYAVSETDDLYRAIDEVKDEIARSLTESKDKELTLIRRGEKIVKNMMKGFSWRLKRFRFKGFKWPRERRDKER